MQSSPAEKTRFFNAERKYSAFRLAFYSATAVGISFALNTIRSFYPNLISAESVSYVTNFSIIIGEVMYSRIINTQSRKAREQFRAEKEARYQRLITEENRLLKILQQKDIPADLRASTLKTYEKVQDVKMNFLEVNEELPEGLGVHRLGQE